MPRTPGLPIGKTLRLALLALFVSLVVGETNPLLAIPAFARKYQTSCQTCHVVFPALTPFGEAFRLNGYRFPAGADASVAKSEPIPLGSDGYKKLWPRSVWPGDIPGMPPIAIVASSEVVNDRQAHSTSFDGVGAALELQTAGTLGDHASWFGNVIFERSDGETSTELERLALLFRPFSTTAFQFKVGSFEPGLLLLSSHRSFIDADIAALSQTVGDNGWAAEPYQQGVEFFGVASHRLLYNVGYVEGVGNASNNAKDFYGRVAWKFGGLRLDGTTEKGDSSGMPASPKPWSEKSLTISAFGYRGQPRLSVTDTVLVNDPNTNIVTPVETTLQQDDAFTVYGGDLSWIFLDLTVHAGYTSRSDDRPFVSDPGVTDVKTKNKFAEADWVALPWLVPAIRWESFDLSGDKTDKISLTVNMLVRANVKTFLAADRLKEPGGSYKNEEVVAGVVWGF